MSSLTDQERSAGWLKLGRAIRESDIVGDAQHVALVLAIFEFEDPPVYTHTLAELSGWTGLSERAVVRALAKLEAASRLLSSTAGVDATTYRLRFNA